MGISKETSKKVKNLEPLTRDEKREVLEDTQRVNFNPIIYQIRASFDLEETIKEFNEQSSKQTGKMIKLTWVIITLTIVMIIGLGVQIGLAERQANYAKIQALPYRIWQERNIQNAISLCEKSPGSSESGLYYDILSLDNMPCSEILEKYK